MTNTANRRFEEMLRRGRIQVKTGDFLDLISFANASGDRYAINPETGAVIGPFGAAVPAIVTINGKRYIQVERAGTNSFVRSGALDNVAWTNSYLGVAASAVADPGGGATSYKCTPTTDDVFHGISQTLAMKSVAAWFRDDGYGFGLLRGTDGVDYISATVDISAGTIAAVETAAKISSLRVLKGDDGWCYGEITTTVAMTSVGVGVSDAADHATFAGDGTKAIEIWQPQASSDAKYLHSLIKTAATAVTVAKDEVTIAAVSVSQGIKDKITVAFYPRWAGTDITTGDIPSICEFADTTQNIQCYYDGSDKKVKVAGRVKDLATAMNTSFDIDNDGTYIYSINNAEDKLQRCPIGGGSITTLATSQDGEAVATDGTYAYFGTTSGSKLLRCPIGGGSIDELVTSGVGRILGITTDSTTYIYWTEFITGKVQRCPIGGGSITTLVTGENGPTGMCMYGTKLYWGTWGGQTIRSSNLDGSGVATVHTASGAVRGIDIDGTNIYYTIHADGLYSVPVGGGTEVPISVGSKTYGGVTLYNATALLVSYPGFVLSSIFKAPFSSGATTHSAYQKLEVTLDRIAGTVKLGGFTTGDGTTTGTSWNRTDGILYVGMDKDKAYPIDDPIRIE